MKGIFDMNRFIRYFNQNRKKILLTVLMIIIILAIINTLNNYYKNKVEENSNNQVANSMNNTVSNSVSTNQLSNTNTGTNKKNNSPTSILKEFITACNDRDISKAYSLLTDDTKKVLYPSEKDFLEEYINKKFNISRSYSYVTTDKIKNRTVYIVELTQDMLATGIVDNNGEQEYVTFVQDEEGTMKITINNFFGIEEVNKQYSKDNVNFIIKNKYIFFDYEIYNITVQNNTEKNICLDGSKTLGSVQILDYNNNKSNLDPADYASSIVVNSKQSKNCEMKFGRVLKKNNANIKKMIFSNVILDYDNFIKSNSNNFSEKDNIEIEF